MFKFNHKPEEESEENNNKLMEKINEQNEARAEGVEKKKREIHKALGDNARAQIEAGLTNPTGKDFDNEAIRELERQKYDLNKQKEALEKIDDARLN